VTEVGTNSLFAALADENHARAFAVTGA